MADQLTDRRIRFTDAELDMILRMYAIAEAGDTGVGDYCWTAQQNAAAASLAGKATEMLEARRAGVNRNQRGRSEHNDLIMNLSPADLQRFWDKVDKTGVCWLWRACTDKGYGVFGEGKRTLRAHRISFFLHTGQFPDILDHLCQNRSCVNPAHLDPVTNRENVIRGRSVTKEACVNGHKYTPDTVARWGKNKRRFCLICVRERRTAAVNP